MGISGALLQYGTFLSKTFKLTYFSEEHVILQTLEHGLILIQALTLIVIHVFIQVAYLVKNFTKLFTQNSKGIFHEAVLLGIGSVLCHLVAIIEAFGILASISKALRFPQTPSSYLGRVCAVGLTYGLIVRARYDELYVLHIVVNDITEYAQPYYAVVTLSFFQREAAESKRQIVENIVFVFFIYKSRYLM